MDLFILNRGEWRLDVAEALATLLMPWEGGWARDVTRPLADDIKRINLVLGMA
jgi:hypothetical protein